jgi:hypothetical protein
MAKDRDNLMALLERLEESIPQSKRKDAIDAILASEPRTTGVRSLRDHEVVQQFRRELADGLIRVDTANKLLGLIRTIVDAAMK